MKIRNGLFLVLSVHLVLVGWVRGQTSSSIAKDPKDRVSKPKRTILVGLWNGEEQGLNGSRAFAADNPALLSGTRLVLNQDSGTGRVAEISMQGFTDAGGFVKRWLSAIPNGSANNLKLIDPASPTGGTDHAAFLCHGIPAFELGSNKWDYETYTWHTNLDTFDKLDFDDLKYNPPLSRRSHASRPTTPKASPANLASPPRILKQTSPTPGPHAETSTELGRESQVIMKYVANSSQTKLIYTHVRMRELKVIVALVFMTGSLAAQSISRSQAVAVRTYLSRLAGFGYSGVVVVSRDGKVVVEDGQGLADRKNKVPFRADTIYDIGSVTKQFTAAAIIALEADGKLNVGDPISTYFPDIPEDKRTITIHHLLTHSAGLESDFGAGDYEKISRAEAVKRATQSKLRFVPGERYAYSNAGYSLLAAIVEIVSGKTYDAFLRERFFARAGMSSTGYFPAGEQTRRVARGYRDGEEWGVGADRAAATGGDFWNLIGNGGVHSTAADMQRWMAALEAGKLLPKDSVEKLFKPHVQITANYRGSNAPLFYGYGWNVWKLPHGKTAIFHLGGNTIFNADVRYHREDRTVLVYGSNVSEFHDPNYPVPPVEKILAGETVEMPPKVAELSKSRMDDFAGRYRAVSGGVLDVEATEGSLKMRGEGQAALSLVTSGRWQTDQKLAAFNERTAKVIDGSRAANYESILPEYRAGTTLKDVSELEALFWKKRHERHGEYKSMRVLGTLPSSRRAFIATTIVKIDFERGTVYRDYWWTPEGKIGDLGPIVAPTAAKYYPVTQKCFARFDPAEAVVISTVCFEGDRLEVIPKGDERVVLRRE